MKRIFAAFFVLLFFQFVFADKVSVLLKNGKSVSGTVTKVEAGSIDGKNVVEVSSINAAQGVNEILVQIKDIKEIIFKSSDDVSCFEDGRFVPVRKYCSMKSVYHVILKTPSKEKTPIEISDERMFIFHIEGAKEPVKVGFYKVLVSNENREDKVDYPDLEREVMEFSRNNIKKLSFN
ncbi:MAG TPA: hypothetical protein PKG52_07745 [bacterium]|nr:hypothetical protein [bacterium]HPS28903.1 hypothetical protein [bacterium]